MYWGTESQTLLVAPVLLGGLVAIVLVLRYGRRFLPLLKGFAFAAIVAGLQGFAAGVQGELFLFHAVASEIQPVDAVYLAGDPAGRIPGGARALLYSAITAMILIVAYVRLKRRTNRVPGASCEEKQR